MALGGVIVVLMGVLAGLGRWGRQRRGWLAVCAAALLLCVAAQVWVGVLLMFDGSDRAAPVWRLREPTVQKVEGAGR